ncbi:MAG: peroxidase family protein [Pikeienuella sp.]
MEHGAVPRGEAQGGNVADAHNTEYSAVLDRYQQLARAMLAARRRGSPDADNHRIPAGYTYLGQFIAHDLAFHVSRSGGPLPAAQGEAGDRTPTLDLDSLYGDGPEADPFRFRAERHSKGRWRFALSPAVSQHSRRFQIPNRAEEVVIGQPKLRIRPPTVPDADMPRSARCPAWFSEDIGEVERDGAEALVADPRNDENLLISQLSVLWMKLHNRVANELVAGYGQGLSKDQALSIYRCARLLTARVYQRVILHDYLKRLLHPDVYEALCGDEQGDPAFLLYTRDRAGVLRERASGDRFDVPPEFWAAAFRIGHVMIRGMYWVNDKLKNRASIVELVEQTGVDSPITPLRDNWIVDLGRYFFRTGYDGGASDLSDGLLAPLSSGGAVREPNFSHKLGLSLVAEMGAGEDISSGPLMKTGGLIYADLARGLTQRLATPSMKNAAEFFEMMPGLVPAGKRLSEDDIRAALSGLARGGPDALKPADIAALSMPQDTPLLVYILAEAQSEMGGNGAHLGPLGSRVVGEVILAAMRTKRNWRAEADAADAEWRMLFGGAEPPKTMPEVLNAL